MRVQFVILCLAIWCLGSLTYAVVPTITSFTPTSGRVGTVVTVTGTYLAASPTAKVNGTTATVNVTSIKLTIAPGTTTGKITVTTSGGTATSATNFTVVAAPIITSFTPISGRVGRVVTITGANFTGATAVKFNGRAATTFTVVSATSITATVPSGATTGRINVTTPGGSVNSATNFTVIPAPSITSFTPASGPVGQVVTITGANLTGATAVKFNGTAATTFTVGSAMSITATVPTGATTGRINVTTPGGSVNSTTSFTVTSGNPSLNIADYLPQQVGNTWIYNNLSTTGYARDHREVIGAATTFHGNAVTPYNCTNWRTSDNSMDNWTEYRVLNATGYYGYGMWDPDEYTADPNDGEEMYISPPIRFLPNTVTVGSTYTSSSSGMTMSVRIAARESITVPAGTFNDALKIEVTFTGTDAPNGFTWWLARNVGMVKNNGSQDDGTPKLWELRYAVINGQALGIPPPTITSFTPTSGNAGQVVTITGTNFTGATAVKFNGTAATTFTVNSATSITVTVPSGATTGRITVTTPGGMATSTANFAILSSNITLLFDEVNSGAPVGSMELQKSGTQVRYLGFYNAPYFFASVGSNIIIPATVAIGTSWTSNSSSNGIAFTTQATVAALTDTVITPAGTFTNCLRTEETNTYADLQQYLTTTNSAVTHRVRWFARGIGPVKYETTCTLASGSTQVSTGTLQSTNFSSATAPTDWWPLATNNTWTFLESDRAHPTIWQIQ